MEKKKRTWGSVKDLISLTLMKKWSDRTSQERPTVLDGLRAFLNTGVAGDQSCLEKTTCIIYYTLRSQNSSPGRFTEQPPRIHPGTDGSIEYKLYSLGIKLEATGIHDWTIQFCQKWMK